MKVLAFNEIGTPFWLPTIGVWWFGFYIRIWHLRTCWLGRGYKVKVTWR